MNEYLLKILVEVVVQQPLRYAGEVDDGGLSTNGETPRCIMNLI